MSHPSPHEQMSRVLTSYWVTQAVYVAAKLGLADLVKDGPRTADDLAKTTATHARSLYCLLRALASAGFFAEDEQRRFGLTPLAECLRSDVPGSHRSMAIMAGEEHYQAWGQLLYSVQTGKVAFDKLYGMPLFQFLSQHPEKARQFDEAMVGIHGRESGAMLDAYDLSDVGVLADLGGGNGSLLSTVLLRYPRMQGILFDLPGVAERAKANFQAAGLAERCRVFGGSFFDSVPAGADVYLLRHIIHDWDDDKAVCILRNVAQAMSHDGKLLVVESVILAGNEACFGKLLDLTMLVVPGGKERTAEEYRTLFAAGGFELTHIVSTRAEVSVIEGKRIG